ncbi:type II secretion system protein GspG [Arhodomonas sp. AD133]|uniref:type II secretion system protein GspG n=1 Tax=Arhodomonas sp. AD133 TaxID=3415009 RepID=UPI003EBF7FC7
MKRFALCLFPCLRCALLVVVSSLLPVLAQGETNKQEYVLHQLHLIRDALIRYKEDVGQFPSAREGLVNLIDQPVDAKGWKGPYLRYPIVPKDAWGNNYRYVQCYISKVAGVMIYSLGPNENDEYGSGDDLVVACAYDKIQDR